MAAEALAFTVENLINAVHSEVSLWDATANAPEERKELSWHRISQSYFKYVVCCRLTDYRYIAKVARAHAPECVQLISTRYRRSITYSGTVLNYADLLSDFLLLTTCRRSVLRQIFVGDLICDLVSDKFDLMETQQTANAKQIKRVFSLSAPVMCDYTVVYKKGSQYFGCKLNEQCPI